jgi:hypothetical protein
VPVIDADAQVCTVIVTVDAEAGVLAEMEAHAREGLSRFAEFEGFLGGATHRSADGTRLVQYLRWQTEAHHLACMNDSRWDDLPSSRRFMELVQSGRASVDVRVYEVVAAREAPGADG